MWVSRIQVERRWRGELEGLAPWDNAQPAGLCEAHTVTKLFPP